MATQYYSSNQGRRSYLNPDAQEFHPLFHTSSTTSFITSTTNTNCFYYNYYPNNSNNFPRYSSSLLPHNILHHAQPATSNYQNYPYNHRHHHHRNSHDVNLVMQPPAQAQIGLGQSAASPVWPRSPASLQSEGSGARSRRRGSIKGSDGSSSNYERKQGFKGNNTGEWSKESRSSCQMIMPVKPDGRETTAMIRNIPNQYTRDMLIKFLDEFCRLENQKWDSLDDHHHPLAFDFLYLPMDFKRDANKGYAFVNFTHSTALWKLHLAFSDRRWEHCRSSKVCGISCAAIQGKERLVQHFGRSKFVCNHEDYLPVCFSPPRDGSNASVVKTTIGQRFSMSSHIEN